MTPLCYLASLGVDRDAFAKKEMSVQKRFSEPRNIPTELLTILEPQNPTIDVSEQHRSLLMGGFGGSGIMKCSVGTREQGGKRKVEKKRERIEEGIRKKKLPSFFSLPQSFKFRFFFLLLVKPLFHDFLLSFSLFYYKTREKIGMNLIGSVSLFP